MCGLETRGFNPHQIIVLLPSYFLIFIFIDPTWSGWGFDRDAETEKGEVVQMFLSSLFISSSVKVGPMRDSTGLFSRNLLFFRVAHIEFPTFQDKP